MPSAHIGIEVETVLSAVNSLAAPPPLEWPVFLIFSGSRRERATVKTESAAGMM